MAPENVSPLVVWLGSVESRDVTGKVFEVEGGKIRVAEGWAHGPQIDKGARWDPAELGPVVTDLLAKARPPVPVYGVARCTRRRASARDFGRCRAGTRSTRPRLGIADDDRDRPVGPGLVVLEDGYMSTNCGQ